MIFWAGKSSDDVNVVVEHYPVRIHAGKKQSAQPIPGRNGDLIFSEKAYSNYIQPYDIYISAEEPRLPAISRRVAEWLGAPEEYQRLEDCYEPDIYRMACYSGPEEIENILNRFGRVTLQFNCKPQRFLKSGEQPVTVKSGTVLHNSTAFEALPLIRITGSGAGRLQVGEYVVEIKSLSSAITLDCELQDAYNGTVNLNNTISAPEFPVLVGGDNEISFTGNWNVEITPRWWTR